MGTGVRLLSRMIPSGLTWIWCSWPISPADRLTGGDSVDPTLRTVLPSNGLPTGCGIGGGLSKVGLVPGEVGVKIIDPSGVDGALLLLAALTLNVMVFPALYASGASLGSGVRVILPFLST